MNGRQLLPAFAVPVQLSNGRTRRITVAGPDAKAAAAHALTVRVGEASVLRVLGEPVRRTP